MADKLDTFEWKNGNNKYPWSGWFDGSIWRLHEGIDFKVPVSSMQSMASQAAKVHGGKCRTSVVDGGLIIQFYRLDPA